MTAQGMAVEQLVAAHGVALLRLAVMLTGTRTDAEDLVQNTLVRLLANERRLQSATAPLAYARRALVNEFVSSSRRPWRREQPAKELPEVGREDPPAPGSLDEGWTMLRSLPPQQRAVLALRYYEDLEDAAIADVLGVATSTVRSNASRGLASLRFTLTTATEELRR